MAKKEEEVDHRDNFQIISDEITRFGGRQKATADSRFICCPLPEHGGVDKTPSLGVYMQIEGKIPLGFFHCFGCGTKGPWNKLAEAAGLQPIKDWKKNSTVAAETILTKDVEEGLLGEEGLTFKSILKKMRCEEAQRWPITMDWRGFSGQLVYAVGGHIINDEYAESIGVLFPIKINGKVRGGVKAIYERKSDKQRAYDNMKGTWVKKYGLFPYMYAAKMIRKLKLKFVFIVEGPRDALRLCSLGIPALAILGATSMSEVKALLVANLGVTHAYIMSDNDKGGDVMAKTAKKFLKKADALKVQRLKLPRKKDANGKLIKMDPGNMPKKIVKRVMEFLKEEHDFEPD
jgi:5S rRNA maturation endonuclease (ribonuclease M5)